MSASGSRRASASTQTLFPGRPATATLPTSDSPWCCMSDEDARPLPTLVFDAEPLAVERMQVICAKLDELAVVGTANDGAAALRLVDALSPDLLLLDMTMPEVDGLSVARELARRPNPPALIFVTAHEDFAVEAFDLEAVDYVLKPVTGER